MKRYKTKYPGVYLLHGTNPATGKPEKIFYIVYRKDGKQIEEKAGRQYKNAMTAARAAAIRGERTRGALSNAERRAKKQAEKGRMTIAKLWEAYAAHRLRRKSLPADEDRFNRYIKPTFGDKVPEEVDPLSLDRFRVKLSKMMAVRTGKPLSPTTVHHIMALLRQIVSFGVVRNLTKGFRGKVPVPPMPQNMKTEDLTQEQLSSLLKALAEEADQDAADVVRLALYTGARRSEILKARWENVDLERSVWILRDRKDGRDSGFPLSSAARQVLQKRLGARRADSPFVFPGSGEEGYLGHPKAAFARIREAARLPEGFRLLHGLRHHYASLLVSSGVDLYVVSKLLGHSDPTLTAKRYAHLRPGVMAEATEIAANLVTAAEETRKRGEKRKRGKDRN